MEQFKERPEPGSALQGPSWGVCANHLGYGGKVFLPPSRNEEARARPHHVRLFWQQLLFALTTRLVCPSPPPTPIAADDGGDPRAPLSSPITSVHASLTPNSQGLPPLLEGSL